MSRVYMFRNSKRSFLAPPCPKTARASHELGFPGSHCAPYDIPSAFRDAVGSASPVKNLCDRRYVAFTSPTHTARHVEPAAPEPAVPGGPHRLAQAARRAAEEARRVRREGVLARGAARARGRGDPRDRGHAAHGRHPLVHRRRVPQARVHVRHLTMREPDHAQAHVLRRRVRQPGRHAVHP
jgi:hypothetical protein